MVENDVFCKRLRGGELSRDFSLLIRGICCVIIVMHHYANLYHNLYGDNNLFLLFLSKYGGCLGVGVFFFLSGYGVSSSSKTKTLSFAQILRQRYWKLIWPILIINILYLVIRYFLGINRCHDYLDVLYNLLNIKLIDSALWFVEVLFYSYALFYIYVYVVKRIGLKGKSEYSVSLFRLLVLISLFGLLTIAIKYFYMERYWYYVNIPLFCLGVVYSEHYKDISRWMTPIVTLFLFIGISGLTLYYTITNQCTFAYIGCALAAVLIIIGIARKYYIVTSYNSLIGIISLEVYLTHYKLLNILSNDRSELNVSFWAYICLALLLGLFCYVIFNRMLPKISKPLSK